MPIFDMECEKCKKKIEVLTFSVREVINKRCECRGEFKKIFPIKSPNFNLKYDPKKDICDWEGNTSQFYRLYNEAKERGENVRLPEKGER